MEKYRCYYLNDFNDDYEAMSKPDEYGDWYRVVDVDARIAELERSGAEYIARTDPLLDKLQPLSDRVAELEKALRWHVGVQHDRYCEISEGKSTCDCGHDLVRRTS